MRFLPRRRSAVALAALASAAAILSCSGTVTNPRDAVKRMVRAYGGPANIAKLQSYIGRGFISDRTNDVVAQNHPFDIYRKGSLYKHKVMAVNRGKLTDVMVLFADGTKGWHWMSRGKTMAVPPAEVAVQRFMFPQVLEWLEEPGIEGEVVTPDTLAGICRLRYAVGDTIVTVELDSKTWLLAFVDIRSTADSSIAYTEAYGYYRDVDGIPFPNGFKGYYRGMLYYDYLIPSVTLGADIPDSLFDLLASDSAGIYKPEQQKKTEAAARKGQ
jgi:hypothetical protein